MKKSMSLGNKNVALREKCVSLGGLAAHDRVAAPYLLGCDIRKGAEGLGGVGECALQALTMCAYSAPTADKYRLPKKAPLDGDGVEAGNVLFGVRATHREHDLSQTVCRSAVISDV